MDACPRNFELVDELQLTSEVIDFPSSRAATYKAALLEYSAKHRPPDGGRTRSEIGEMPGLLRIIALRQSEVSGVVAYYATHPHAEPAPGILVLITAFSDNSVGACSISLDRIALLLRRDRRTISAALSRLKDAGLVASEAVSGRPNLLNPYVHESFGQSKDPLTLILDAWAPRQPAKPVGRPRKQPDEIPPLSCKPPQFQENTPLNQYGPLFPRPRNTPLNQTKYPPHPACPPILL